MIHDSRAESSGISRRLFLGFGAAAGAAACLTLRAQPAEAASVSPAPPQPDSAPAERPHRTLLGLL